VAEPRWGGRRDAAVGGAVASPVGGLLPMVAAVPQVRGGGCRGERHHPEIEVVKATGGGTAGQRGRMGMEGEQAIEEEEGCYW
jgi:hypothetical protein